MPSHLKGVVFDIGGVVLRSPFIAIAAYERKLGIPENYINCSIVGRGSNGAWQKFERGELPLFEFYEAFGAELSDTESGNVWYQDYCRQKGIPCPPLPHKLKVDGRVLFGSMMRESSTYDPHMLRAIHHIRALGAYKIIALTNNFAKTDVPASELAFLGWGDGGPTPPHLRELFDDFCDSSTLGMRKPEPEFYLTACRRNNLLPSQVVFLDDIGINLKAAKTLGMETIHVPIGGTLEAVRALGDKLGIDLTSPGLSSDVTNRPKL
ncbi:HAD-like domain-containing protein [Collybia nuda]|uniref:HAD-like domain-containing protein n=1 Tax=Collybia nuda TaxID=64659 RepID=A0A9P5XVT8_9AGAR|nr:HAD-like domain-containing protein [Collybia nuda]